MNRLENLSSCLDGELSESELADLFRTIHAPDLEKAEEFLLVGDLLRSSDLAEFHSPDLVGKIYASIESEPTVISSTLVSMARSRKPSFWSGRWVASAAAVCLFSLAIYQSVPPIASEVQMVKTNSSTTMTDREIALWQEYFLAHQQNVLRGGLAGVSPIARADAYQPRVENTERVKMDQSQVSDWMNVWAPDPYMDQNHVQYQYVSASR